VAGTFLQTLLGAYLLFLNNWKDPMLIIKITAFMTSDLGRPVLGYRNSSPTSTPEQYWQKNRTIF